MQDAELILRLRRTGKSGRFSFENQLALSTLFASLIPSVLLLVTLWVQGLSRYLILLLAIILGSLIAWAVTFVHNRSLYQFRSMSNLLQAMVKGDYSLRARVIGKDGALLELVNSINALSGTLNRERLLTIESQLLIGKIIDQIDVAILAVDSDRRITLLNPAAGLLLAIELNDHRPVTEDRLPAALQQLISMDSGQSQVGDFSFATRKGRFHVHKEQFRDQGVSQDLVFITDVRTILRAEEHKAWQNLIRVLGHEINNSLAPIASVSDTLAQRVSRDLDRDSLDAETGERLLRGLALVGERANSLADFTNRYRQLARLPQPAQQKTDLAGLVERVVALFRKGQARSVPVHVLPGPVLSLDLDVSQIEQVLINLLKNAGESMTDGQAQFSDGEITIGWKTTGTQLHLSIEDEGQGLVNPDNLFVPFYTTKPDGSGIGLVLCRQIIEAHGGYLSLANRIDHSGCRAIIELPIPNS